MSYYLQGFGSAAGLGIDKGCDLAETFDPAQVAAWITKAGQNCGSQCNAAGKKYTYWIVAALWRLGYTVADFDMMLVPDTGYVNWGDKQAAAYRQWRKNRTGSSGSYFPAPGEMQALKDDLVNNNITGPNPPKIVCISGDTAVDITPVAVEACPPGWSGTPPMCTPPATTPDSCPPGTTGTPPDCQPVPGPARPPVVIKKCKTGQKLVNGKCVTPSSNAGMITGLAILAIAAAAALVAAKSKKKTALAAASKPAAAPRALAPVRARARMRRRVAARPI